MSPWLNKPYPLLTNKRDKFILAFSFALFVFLFLLIFEPFDSHKIPYQKPLFFAGFGLCTFIGLCITYFLFPALISKIFNPEKWQIKKEIGYLMSSFLVITILNYFYYDSFIPRDVGLKSIWEFLGITTVIGLFPMVILIFILERKLSKKNSDDAADWSKSILTKELSSVDDKQISIAPESLKSSPLHLNLRDFVFAKSDNNYTTIFYLENEALQKSLIRLSIKNLEQQLSKYSTIVRCHRSYLVNKQKISALKGNARSLVLKVEQYPGVIPISRQFPKEKLV